jgi:xanthine dehydrogenase YagS FAD-binding subunit
MEAFAYAAAPTAPAAIAHVAQTRGAQFIAGGTDLLQLLQEGVIAPAELIDINFLPLAGIDIGPGGARIGALTRLSEVADHAGIRDRFPAIAEALIETASPQVRNAATVGGNLLQRTRCLYFRDAATPCNKRVPGSGCPAQDGQNRINAILGGSEHCIATHPSDLAVALVALEAQVQTSGPSGDRTIPIADLHRVPGDTPQIETVLEPGELITAVLVPESGYARHSRYLKIRDRAEFEWAIASAAVALETDGGTVRQARVAVGGVATKPWRLPRVEAALAGARIDEDALRAAAEQAAEGAAPRGQNRYKVELVKRTVQRALMMAGGVA